MVKLPTKTDNARFHDATTKSGDEREDDDTLSELDRDGAVESLPRIAPPDVVALLGTGGMATVHAARDNPLKREVALKRMRDDTRLDPGKREDFLREARITGQLQHPNIVPIHALGTDDDDEPFFTMQIVEGRTLRQWLSHTERAPGSRERVERGLEILLKVCDAVAYAHSKGVLHRDIKPDNVMVGLHGRVYLMDWGVAIGPVDRAAEPRGIAGTPGYMAPEQARGERLDERADVFGLGALLYEILTGEIPYDDTAESLILEAADGAIVPIGIVAPVSISPRICAIAERALAPEPGDRYGSVGEFQEDLRRFLQGGFHLPQLTFREGEVILEEGTSGDSAYLILKGSCHVRQKADDQIRELRTMIAGDIFGELALVLEGPRTATVIAAEKTTLLVIDRDALESSGALHGWSAALLTALARRFRDLEKSRQG